MNRDDFEGQLIAFLPNMRRFALSLVRSVDRADDLVQAACERCLSNAERFEPGTRFDAWMFRIIRNLAIDAARRRATAGPQEAIEEQLDLIGEPGETSALARLELNEVGQAILALPAEQREVLLLVCVEDFSYRDAAAVLDVPIGTVMSRLARARAKLADTAGITGAEARSSREKGQLR